MKKKDNVWNIVTLQIQDKICKEIVSFIWDAAYRGVETSIWTKVRFFVHGRVHRRVFSRIWRPIMESHYD